MKAIIKNYINKIFTCSGLAVATLITSVTVNAQQSYTFTNAGATGINGPSQTQVTNAYQNTSLANSVQVVQGIQQFTIPTTGGYKIEAWGGQGVGLNGVGGRGAYMSGEFQLTAGQVIKILVGQQGEMPSNVSYDAQYGGGGGSFVTDFSNNPLVVAGGGGGNWTSAFSAISDAPTSTSANTGGGAGSTGGAGGVSGTGGGANTSADGGAGMTTDGAGTAGGKAFVNGGAGGFTTYGIGGFGGGGGTSSYNNRRGGGGGGYSGGGGSHGSTTGFPEGGGGGSFNSGNNQVNNAGVNLGHGKVVITDLCRLSLSASQNPICIGSSITLSTNAVSTITWSAGGSANTITVSPTTTTSYTVTGTGTANCVGSAIIVVTVNPLPVVSTAVQPTVLCAGENATLAASGASSYTWSSGPTTNTAIVNPVVNTIYTVTGTSFFGCQKTATVEVNLNTNTVTINATSNTVCAGNPVQLSASGISTYTWTPPSLFPTITVYPQSNTVYQVSGRDANYCIISNSIMISALPKPNMSATAERPTICKGESTNLVATGATSYTWSNSVPGPSITVTLPVDVTYYYSVIGKNTDGCADTAFVSVMVLSCTGLNETTDISSLSIYPNPATDKLFVSKEISQAAYRITDVTGKVVQEGSFSNGGTSESYIGISNLDKGLYTITIISNDRSVNQKVLKE